MAQPTLAIVKRLAASIIMQTKAC